MMNQEKPFGVEFEGVFITEITGIGSLFGVPALFGTNNFVFTRSHLHTHLDVDGNQITLSGEVADTIRSECKTFADVAELLLGKEIVVQIIPYKKWLGDRIVESHTLKLDWVE